MKAFSTELEAPTPLGNATNVAKKKSSRSGCADIKGMSALPAKADMCGARRNVRYGPIADIATLLYLIR
jgi:hypothetical protein